MASATIALAELAEKGADLDVLSQMVQFMAQRRKQPDVEGRGRSALRYGRAGGAVGHATASGATGRVAAEASVSHGSVNNGAARSNG